MHRTSRGCYSPCGVRAVGLTPSSAVRGLQGHLGYETMDHLPINRGFASHVGYLEGSQVPPPPPSRRAAAVEFSH
jgi:hypothetical protein